MILVFALQISNYLVMVPQIQNSATWSQNIASKCGAEKLNDAFTTKSMIDNGFIGLGFGSYYGLIIHAYLFPGMIHKKQINESWWKMLARPFIGAIANLPFFSLYLLGPEQIENVYLLMVLKSFMPTLCLGLIMFGFNDRLCMSLGLLTFQDDLMLLGDRSRAAH